MSTDRTPEQEAAVTCTDQDILVEAGAGTGKTKTTVDRYSRLISENPDPARILVFTFTDKAATELRERVRKRRDENLEAGGTETFSMGSAWVGTFHSICSRILRSHPIQADVDPSFAVLDDVQALRLKESAYDRALSRFMAGEEEEQLIARFTPSHLRRGVSNAYGQLRARGEINPTLPEPEMPEISEVLAKVLLVARDSLATPRIQKKTVAQIQGMIDFFESVDHHGLTFEAFERNRMQSKSDKLGPLKEAIKDLRSALAANEFGAAYLAGLARLFVMYAEEYSARKVAAGVLDYEDLQLVTLRLLRDNEPVAQRYREQFDEIMVDEFQDTNQLQLNLIDELRGENTKLFTVGDEMQAIYGFRHADVRLFRTRRNNPGVTVLPLSANFRSQAPVIGAVNLVGSKLDDVASDGLNPREQAERHKFAPLRVGRETDQAEGDQVELLFTESKGWLGQNLGPMSPAVEPDQHHGPATDGQYQAEALLLAQHISDAVRFRGVKPGEIAILFRAKSRMWMYVEALKQVGLKPYVVGGTGFWDTREGVDLKSLLAAIANPLDDDSLLGSLAGPACGLSTDALLVLSAEAGGRSPIWPSLVGLAGGDLHLEISEVDVQRARRFVEAVISLRERAPLIGLGDLVEEATRGTGYDLVNLIRDPSGSGLANIRRVASLAADFETAERRDLRGFLDWIEISARLDAEAAVATEDEDGDAVQLMTVHKSKGLEFEMVCVADLGRQRKARSEAVFWLGQLNGEQADGTLGFGLRLPMPDGSNLDLYDWSRLAEESAAEAADEELRLFHVALTRAKRRLVMSGIDDLDAEKEPTKSASTAKLISSAMGVDRDGPEALDVPAPEPGVQLNRPPADSQIRILRNDANEDQAEYLRRSIEMVSLAPERPHTRPPIDRPAFSSFPTVPLSYSALSEFVECPARFYASRVLRLDSTGATERPLDPEDSSWTPDYDGTRFGNAVHKLLERIAERGWVPATDGEIESALNEFGVETSDPAVLDRARTMISDFTSSELGEGLRAETVETEANLLLTIGETTLRGAADLISRHSNPPLIVDYKSNRLGESGPAEKMESYLLQRDLYALAVSRALDAPVVRIAYVFLQAASEPVIFEFGETELAEAEAELERVVGSITSGQYLTASPGAPDGPCGSCWACDRLKDQIQRAAAEAVGGI